MRGSPRALSVRASDRSTTSVAAVGAAQCDRAAVPGRSLCRPGSRNVRGRIAGPHPHRDAPLDALLEMGLLTRETTEPVWFEVLPASRMVWRANGARPPRWIPTRREEF